MVPHPTQCALPEPLCDIHPRTGVSIEVFMPIMRWKRSAGPGLVGFGGLGSAAVRQTARPLGRLLRATPRISTR